MTQAELVSEKMFLLLTELNEIMPIEEILSHFKDCVEALEDVYYVE